MRILVAEDDAILADGVAISLRQSGYAVDWVKNGLEADSALEGDDIDLLILDLGLPRKSGLDVLKRLRQRDSRVPVLILTARDGVDDRVRGLDAGADDYLAKPFAVEELLARLRALLRRTATPSRVLEAGAVRLDPETHEVTSGGRPVELTAREFALLAFLMQTPGRVYTREQIFESVWGYDYLGDSKVIDVFVSALRRKLDRPPEESIVRTVRGVGYTVRP
jgi:DNA-binding response OmpR family regulator